MKSDKKNYLIILLYGIILIAVMLGFNNLYGSSTDWISQHSVIPDYFRKIFYETGNLAPDLAINIGAGQNIFNYSYYGLLSPVILMSYFLPFLNMTTYIIIASILLYLASGILMYKFLKNNTSDNKLSLVLSLALITFSSITYQSHHHIMFVWYMPLLILALIGVDKYIKSNKSFILMISIFLIIMTNYYYSIPAIIAVLLYGVYKLFDKKEFNLKEFLIDVFKASIRIIVPILMAAIILIPTAYVIMNSGRLSDVSNSLIDLIYPNLKEVVYKSFSMGITAIFLLAPIGLIATKKKKKSEVFLGVSTLIITLIPIFMYALNGFLYIRGKVLIPFVVIYIIMLAMFIKNIKDKNINYKALGVGALILILFALFDNYKDDVLICFSIDVIISFILILLFNKYQKNYILYIPIILFLFVSSIINNTNEEYVSIDRYENINSSDVITLLDSINDHGYYRSINENFPLDTSNKYYNENYYSATLYSSNYNNNYWNFYNFGVGNNIVYRNLFVSAGTTNELFNNLMGIKYVLSNDNPGLGYEEVASSGDLNLYYNKLAFPLVYVTDNVGSSEVYESLEFPYNVDYMLNSPIVDGGYVDYESHIEQLDWKLDDNYTFKLDESTTYNYELPEVISNKYLIITFDMDYNEACSRGDTTITINGEVNKLTCRSWRYHNQNHTFEYVLSSNEDIRDLEIEISKGRFEISNINIYTMDYREINYEEIDDLNIDKGSSKITGKVEAENDSYVITSIPYDEGFSVMVDDEEVNAEIVNSAFVGFRVPAGIHNIEISYNSPGKLLGILVSIIGLLGLIAVCIYEKFQEKFDKLFKKYQEIIMYLIFGVLTTVISIVTYFIFTHTFLDAHNSLELQIANVLSWVISVLFAYVTNRIFVFASENKNILKEIVSFFSSRIVTLLIDMFLMFILVTCLHYNDAISKILVQIVVIIGNYILSKLIVFKKGSSSK